MRLVIVESESEMAVAGRSIDAHAMRSISAAIVSRIESAAARNDRVPSLLKDLGITEARVHSVAEVNQKIAAAAAAQPDRYGKVEQRFAAKGVLLELAS